MDFVVTTKNGKIVIPGKIFENPKNYHVMGVTFLIDNYLKKRGSILNLEDGMNMQFQVAAFLSAFANEIRDDNLPVVILTPETSIPKWHYHLIKSDLDVRVLKDVAELEYADVYIVPSEFIKASKQFVDIDLFAVVIDEIDTICHKLIIRKLKGRINIGLTVRNFYVNRNCKTLWQILNWANEGSVGKSKQFAKLDRGIFLSGRDPYRIWWLRLTWTFCRSFVKPTNEEEETYRNILDDWTRNYKLHPTRTIKKRRLKTDPCVIIDSKVKKTNDFVVDEKESEIKDNLSNNPEPNREDSDDDNFLKDLVSAKSIPIQGNVPDVTLEDSSDSDIPELTSKTVSDSDSDVISELVKKSVRETSDDILTETDVGYLDRNVPVSESQKDLLRRLFFDE